MTTLEDICLKNIAKQIYTEWKIVASEKQMSFQWAGRKSEADVTEYFYMTCCFNKTVFECLINKVRIKYPRFYLYITFEINKKKLWDLINSHNKSCMFMELGHD